MIQPRGEPHIGGRNLLHLPGFPPVCWVTLPLTFLRIVNLGEFRFDFRGFFRVFCRVFRWKFSQETFARGGGTRGCGHRAQCLRAFDAYDPTEWLRLMWVVMIYVNMRVVLLVVVVGWLLFVFFSC